MCSLIRQGSTRKRKSHFSLIPHIYGLSELCNGRIVVQIHHRQSQVGHVLHQPNKNLIRTLIPDKNNDLGYSLLCSRLPQPCQYKEELGYNESQDLWG